MNPELSTYGFCPLCGSRLEFNRITDQVMCSNIDCMYYREYAKTDREAIEKQLSEYFQNEMKWEKYYGKEDKSK